jgi:hypothetical protein
MMLFAQVVAIVAGLALGVTLTGRSLAVLFRIRLLTRSGVENLIVSGWLGTASWILVFGVCSYLGMAARPATMVVFGSSSLLLVGAAAKGRPGWLIPRRWTIHFLTVGLACSLAVIGYLLPLAVGKCYCFANDAMHYVQTSEWLQEHGFGEPAPLDFEQPVAGGIHDRQSGGYRVGPQFLLALLQSLLGRRFLAVELFPAAMAWGLALNVGSIFVLCRWAFRMDRSIAVLAAWLAAVTVNPLTWSADDGYFCQVFATATMSLAAAIFARLIRPARWQIGHACLLAPLGAFMLSAYSEMAPVLAVAATGYCTICWFRGAKTKTKSQCPVVGSSTHSLEQGSASIHDGASFRRGFLAFAGLTLTLLMLLGNIEIVRAFRMLSAHAGRPGPCPGWSDLDSCTFLLGLRAFAMPVHASARVLLGLAAPLVVIGLLRSISSWRTLPVFIIAVTYACLYTFGHPLLRGRPGDTFVDLKITQWAYPLVAVLEVAGAHWLTRRLVARRPILRAVLTTTACLSLLVLSAPGRRRDCQEIVQRMHFLMDSNDPFRELRELRRKLDERRVRSVLVVNPSGALVPGGFAPFMLYPRHFYHQSCRWWPRCDVGDIDLPAALPDDVIELMIGLPACEPTGERWPCGLWRLEPSAPVVRHFRGRNGLERWQNGEMFYWLDTEPAQLEIWSPHGGVVHLSFNAVPGPSMPAAMPRHFRAGGPNGQVLEMLIEGTTAVSLPLEFHAGTNHVELSCLDEPTIAPLPGGDPRTLLLGIQRLRIDSR